MKFPDIPMFPGSNAPRRIELDLCDPEVDGELPRDLAGAFYRRVKEMRTDVFLFDALRIDAGPLATIRLPVRLRPGYHGNRASRAQLGG
jgi:carotenoid cleavage dioxygenase-like enzyme